MVSPAPPNTLTPGDPTWVPNGARLSWRNLPPQPPYGPIGPPRPELVPGAPLSVAPPVPPTAGWSTGRILLVAGVSVLVLALGVGLGLWLAGDDTADTLAEASPVPADPAPAPAPPPGPVPDEFAPADPLPGDPGAPEQDFGDLFGDLEDLMPPEAFDEDGNLGGDSFDEPGMAPPFTLPRLFEVIVVPSGYGERETSVRQTVGADEPMAEQTTTLDGGGPDITVHGVRGPDAEQVLSDALDAEGAEPIAIAGTDGTVVTAADGTTTITWQVDDLVLEVSAAEGVARDDLVAVAEGVGVVE